MAEAAQFQCSGWWSRTTLMVMLSDAVPPSWVFCFQVRNEQMNNPFPIVLHLPEADGSEFHFSIFSVGLGQYMCLAAKTSGKGRCIKHPPHGWIIRSDPPGSSHEGQPRHWHCCRDGKEIVITSLGTGSHATESGDPIPKKLGDYFVDELGINIKRTETGKYIVRLLPSWGISSRFNYGLVLFLDDLINREVILGTSE